MSENSKIEWTTHTFNPWIGCTKVSPGCANCYAETEDKRRGWTPEGWGKGKPRKRTTATYWKQALKWNAAELLYCDCHGNGYANEGACLHTDRLHRPRVFPSLCDWLDPEAPIEWLADFLQLIHDTPNLDWLLLTKRPELFRTRLVDALRLAGSSKYEARYPIGFIRCLQSWLGGTLNGDPVAPRNVWLGVSIEDQTRAAERIPLLLDTPAHIRFLSCEPLLGPIDLWGYSAFNEDLTGSPGSNLERLDWVITGGESGPKARPCNVQWIRDIVSQSKAAGVPVFLKQLGRNIVDRNDAGFEGDLGEWPMDTHFRELDYGYQGAPVQVLLNDRKGGDPSEWKKALRIRQFPQPQPATEKQMAPA